MRYLLFTSILLVLAACNLNSKVQISKSGATHVDFALTIDGVEGEEESEEEVKEGDFDEKDSLTAVWKKPYCKNFQLDYNESAMNWSFDLDNIDLLGTYITEQFEYKVSFTKKKKSLVVDGEDGNCKTEDDPGGYFSMMKFDFTLSFEQKVVAVQSDCDCAEKIDDHSVRLKGTLGDLRYNQKKNVIKIKLK